MESPNAASQEITTLRRELAGLATAQHELVCCDAGSCPANCFRSVLSLQAGAMREISRTMQSLNAKLDQLGPRQSKRPSTELPRKDFDLKNAARRRPTSRARLPLWGSVGRLTCAG
jgi:hypothetical protein